MRRVLLVGLLVVLVAVAGCAGVDDGASSPTPSPNPTVTPTETPAPTVSPTETPTPTNTPTSTPTATPTPTETPTTPQPDLVKVHYMDVGQADATVIEFPNGETMLIDSGDWRQSGSEVISYLNSLDVDHLDHLVATHPHADHIGGHAEIIEYFEENRDGVGAVYDTGVPHTSQTYEDYIDALETYETDVYEVRAGDTLDIGGATLMFVNPQPGTDAEDLHYNSMGLVIEWGSTSFLFTGDAEENAETEMVDAWADDLDADIYQVGHHGSRTSSSDAFLDAVEPAVAIISSDYDSQYGHPHDETLDRLAALNIETYWTGVHGTIKVISDGSGYDIEPETDATTDPSELKEQKSENPESITFTSGVRIPLPA